MKIIRKKELRALYAEIERLKAINEEASDWKRWCTMAEDKAKDLKVEIEEIKRDGIMSQIMPLTKNMTHKEIEHCIGVSFTTLVNNAVTLLGVGIKDLRYNVSMDRHDCGVYFIEIPTSNIDIEFNKTQYKLTKI